MVPEWRQAGLTGNIHLGYRNESLLTFSFYPPLADDTRPAPFFTPPLRDEKSLHHVIFQLAQSRTNLELVSENFSKSFHILGQYQFLVEVGTYELSSLIAHLFPASICKNEKTFDGHRQRFSALGVA